MDGIKTFYVNISNNKIIKIEDIIFKNNTGILLFKTTKDIDKELIKIIKQYGKDLSSLHSFQEIKQSIMNIIKNWYYWYYKKNNKNIDNCLLTKILSQIDMYKQEDFMFIKLMNEDEYNKLRNVNKTLKQIKKQNR